jgi:20S proteasome alpha/beta subunit
MTLILGLKSKNCVVIGAEQEESGGIVAKHSVTKLRLITGPDWAVVVGGAGDGAVAENAMRDMDRRLHQERVVNEKVLMNITDSVLDDVYTKYIDKDAQSEGLSLVIGASCGDGMHLISTIKRVPQPQDRIAYAGIGADIGIYFMDRLHRPDEDWTYAVSVAGFTLQQAMESCRYCSGESEVYVLQGFPNPRWRSLGTYDAPMEFQNLYQGPVVAEHLSKLLTKRPFKPEGFIGYRDEHRPKERTPKEVQEDMEHLVEELKRKGGTKEKD